MYRARDMALRDVRDLVSKDARKFVFIARGLEQAGVYADESAGEGKGIDIGVIDDEKAEALTAVIGLCSDPASDFVDVLGNERILDDCPCHPDLRHDRAPEPGFIRLGQYGIGRASHIRQLDIVGAGAAGHYQQRGY
jgi:hypothetical protein